jgi:hypothetical protein
MASQADKQTDTLRKAQRAVRALSTESRARVYVEAGLNQATADMVAGVEAGTYGGTRSQAVDTFYAGERQNALSAAAKGMTPIQGMVESAKRGQIVFPALKALQDQATAAQAAGVTAGGSMTDQSWMQGKGLGARQYIGSGGIPTVGVGYQNLRGANAGRLDVVHHAAEGPMISLPALMDHPDVKRGVGAAVQEQGVAARTREVPGFDAGRGNPANW